MMAMKKKKSWKDIRDDQHQRILKGIEYINDNEPFYVQACVQNGKSTQRFSININIITTSGQKPHKFVANVKSKRYRYEFLKNIPKHKNWIGYSQALECYDTIEGFHLGKIRNRKDPRYYTDSKMVPLTAVGLYLDNNEVVVKIWWNKHTWVIPLEAVNAKTDAKTAQIFSHKGHIQQEEESWW